MNTLSRAAIAQLFGTKTAYLGLRAHWGALMTSERKHDLAAGHHLLYLTLIGRDWRKGFSPFTNRWKLANGAFANWNLFKAMRALHSPMVEQDLLEPFGEWVTKDMLEMIRQLVPKVGPYAYSAEDFVNGVFPFDAYEVSDDVGAIQTSEVEPMQ